MRGGSYELEARLARVEEQMKGVAEDVGDIKTSLKDIATSLKTLAVLEEKHNNAAEALKRAFKAIEKNTERLDQIDKALPDLKLASGWVFKAVVGAMGLSGAAAIAMILERIFK